MSNAPYGDEAHLHDDAALSGGEQVDALACVRRRLCLHAGAGAGQCPGDPLDGWRRQCLSEIGIEALVRSVGKRP
jgi:hypothetical protein